MINIPKWLILKKQQPIVANFMMKCAKKELLFLDKNENREYTEYEMVKFHKILDNSLIRNMSEKSSLRDDLLTLLS